ncbi:hypothetical protein [Geoalkalibacter halelectricus]|uniref:PH domain-containing protein n=1 Tax=Geoalkalibacter halelectricus TaxID=2847045 RepID=A0ABY5ZKL1_9BACT|nr:hypothetical protein [Geoalkalibacter halelectricus]MDO3378041.1 hypothetical protein [Geoalkalibacter halelectricus]UWZ78340.1 hypothetical protein L9S41_11635 [Geoalkalibacter halelectricus]
MNTYSSALPRQFRIRRAFLLPLGLLLGLTVLLLVICLLQGLRDGKVIILGAMLLPIGGLFVESLARRTEIDPEGVTVHKFLRRRRLPFVELTAVEATLVRKRAFLSLSSLDSFVIFSNAYENFPQLVQTLMTQVPDEVISADARKLAADPPTKSTDIISCWVAVALMVLILLVQLFSGG